MKNHDIHENKNVCPEFNGEKMHEQQAYSHSINYDCLRQVISYDTLRVVMMCLRHSLKLQGNHIITLA